MSRIDKSRDREWSTGCLGLGAGVTGVTAYAFQASFGHDDCSKIVWMVIQFCEYSENHGIAHFK